MRNLNCTRAENGNKEIPKYRRYLKIYLLKLSSIKSFFLILNNYFS